MTESEGEPIGERQPLGPGGHPNQIKVPRNLWGVSVTSFLTDVSSEMVTNLLPIYLTTVLGVKTSVVGLIEGVGESSASVLKVFSGWISDRLQRRKSLAVAGYALSTISKAFYLVATSWGAIAGVRWADRVGKGLRTAPRDALIADSLEKGRRGFAFGFHRSSDTLGAVAGLAIALLVLTLTQTDAGTLTRSMFQTIVVISLVPAGLAVVVLAVATRDVPSVAEHGAASVGFAGLGRPFLLFLAIVGLFDLGNSSDAFLILRAEERGVSIVGLLAMLIAFNLVYATVSVLAGSASDHVGRRRIIIAGWLLYAGIYLGFAVVETPTQTWALFTAYGFYYGLTYGTAKALVADLVPPDRRGTAYGTFNATLGLLDLPASLIAGILWQGLGTWSGFGPAAPFLFGATTALAAAAALWLFHPLAGDESLDAGPLGHSDGPPATRLAPAAEPVPTASLDT